MPYPQGGLGKPEVSAVELSCVPNLGLDEVVPCSIDASLQPMQQGRGRGRRA